MREWNPFIMDEFTWDILKTYIKHGYGESKLYTTTFFGCHLTDETVCMTLNELHDKVMDYEGVLWSKKC